MKFNCIIEVDILQSELLSLDISLGKSFFFFLLTPESPPFFWPSIENTFDIWSLRSHSGREVEFFCLFCEFCLPPFNPPFSQHYKSPFCFEKISLTLICSEMDSSLPSSEISAGFCRARVIQTQITPRHKYFMIKANWDHFFFFCGFNLFSGTIVLNSVGSVFRAVGSKPIICNPYPYYKF